MGRGFLLAAAMVLLAGCASDDPLKVISFNVRVCIDDTFDGENNWRFRREAAVKMLQDEQPDFFGLQEALYHQAKYIDESLPEYTKYGVDREGGVEKGEAESCALFYRNDKYKLLDKGTFWLSQTPEEPSRGWDAACHRVATWALLKQKGLGGREILFVNTHFDHKGKEARANSGRLIMERIGEMAPQGAIIILTGDFNAEIDDMAVAPIREALAYSRETAPVTDSTTTYNAWGRRETPTIIDHIFYRNLTPLSYKTVTRDYGVPYISDHYPIVFEADFE